MMGNECVAHSINLGGPERAGPGPDPAGADERFER